MSNEKPKNNNNNNTAQNSLPHKPEIRTANDSKQWITEKCGTNTPPTTTPNQPPSNNK